MTCLKTFHRFLKNFHLSETIVETEVKRRIILKLYTNQDLWIEVKKTTLVKGDIWEYVNLEAIYPIDTATISLGDLKGCTILKILTKPV